MVYQPIMVQSAALIIFLIINAFLSMLGLNNNARATPVLTDDMNTTPFLMNEPFAAKYHR